MPPRIPFLFPRAVGAVALSLLALNAFASGSHDGAHAAKAAKNAVGKPGKAAQVSRSVTVDMNDAMRFIPASIQVKQGETVKFTVKNSGKIKHEMVLGSIQELQEHNELMKKHPNMEHDEPNQITVAPGQSGEIIWRFSQAGSVDFACLQPGHYEAGMKGQVQVAGLAKNNQTKNNQAKASEVAHAQH